MKTLPFRASQLEALRSLRAAAPEATIALIGAGALSCHLPGTRETKDIDLVVSLSAPDSHGPTSAIESFAALATKLRWQALAMVMGCAVFGACATPQPLAVAPLPAEEARPSAVASAPPSAAPSSSAAPSAAATHVWTKEEIDDRCGFKGDLICCLGPAMPGPPPKPFCRPAK